MSPKVSQLSLLLFELPFGKWIRYSNLCLLRIKKKGLLNSGCFTVLGSLFQVISNCRDGAAMFLTVHGDVMFWTLKSL